MQEDRRKKDCRKDWLLLSIIGAAFLLTLLNATVFLFSRSGEVFVEFSWYVPLFSAIILAAVLGGALLILLRREREKTCVVDQTSAELRESRDRLILAQQAGRVGIFDWDVGTGKLIWSEQLEKLFGLPPGSFEGNYEGWAKRLHPDDRPEIESQFRQWVRERRRDIEFEHRFIRSDTAEVRWMAISGRLSYLADGTPARMIGTKVDITERKQAEEALRKAKEELEERVKERTVELERRNQELQEFAFVASHDLSEPLRKIQTFGTLLKTRSEERLDEKDKAYISRMTAAAERMQKLLEGLLRYSRIQTRAQEFESVKLGEVVQSAVNDLELVISQANARIEVIPLPEVTGDREQLQQLFQNLIANSVKFRRPGVDPVVKIYAERNRRFNRIMVEDNGIGFEEKYLDRIFTPFQRLHGRGEYEGIGMGLAICKKIAERHGGTISAESTPGQGSKFKVDFPVNQTVESKT